MHFYAYNRKLCRRKHLTLLLHGYNVVVIVSTGLAKAGKKEFKPYFMYNNVQMEQIIAEMPEAHRELMQTKGFADKNCSKYGDAIIDIVKKFKQDA